jgi:predicted nucleic acid-binding Zn ribbon protein
MPVYEYEHLEGPCPLGEDRFALLQEADEEPLRFCVWCGADVRRVVSQVSIKLRKSFSAADAAKHGLTTWRRARRGEWEKVDGPGVDAIVASPEDIEAVDQERKGPSPATDP